MFCNLTSCSSDDESLTEYDADWIIGSWDVTESKGAPYDGRLTFLVYSNQLSVFEDGIEVEEYWYEIENGVLMLTEKGDDEVSAKCETLSLTETTAKCRLTDLKYGYGSYTVSLRKKK
jgi:hypothetical protein